MKAFLRTVRLYFKTLEQIVTVILLMMVTAWLLYGAVALLSGSTIALLGGL